MGNVSGKLDKQIEATDGTPRLRGGRLFGLWAYNNGSKYWDELGVVSLTAVSTPTPAVTETAVTNGYSNPTPNQPTTRPHRHPAGDVTIAGQPIAMRVTGDPVAANNGLHYLYSDHPRLRGDRLGSNSTMQAPDGSITHTRYEPFGAYRGGSGGNAITDRGYTGHKQNDSLGLIYMNARFYVPGIARFASADTIVPNLMNPQSFNRYSYVLNSPVNFTDPTGHDGMWCNDPSEGGAGCNETQYDLTGWLPSAMRRGAQAEVLNSMREAFNNAQTSRFEFQREYHQVIWGKELLTTFKDLNTGYGQWDVKRETENIVGLGITLCSGGTCRWVDYSVPGNILYGYVAASVGVTEDVSRAAGGALELWEGTADSANNGNWYEDPYDSAAVGFGYQLYAAYGSDVTGEEFNNALTVDILESFQPVPAGFPPPSSPISQSNSYSVGAFDCFSENGCLSP